ncbi:Gfo/Idh/MocA family oxidoreductase [Mycobacterium sp. 236(2023)]|uniref:Gfo/Idh/MocA family protein n=1 Tax=Mycobacterium sp. 236(2023) TaxID=3038163 RepID=UPI0024153459|nr:Gfo/Idh/MocA family oxidoreductase [Mycobacterium sp. 236(2023)]MDG4665378.1 Gfo/Idh/MocA family oxidoreductase [Mycobacterium sp. 236(2023)]
MISVLVIGAGAVVEEHYRPPLRRLEKAKAIQVLGVVDPNESRGRLIADRFKRARAYPDCEAAFQADSYDLAIIASPPGFHADNACAAFEHGSHVLCEKPMTTTVADADRMNAAAAKAGRVLGVAYPRRFYSNFADVARLVADGELGNDLEFTYREGHTYGWPAATDAAFRRERAGGGALLDIGVHMLDHLSWIFGDPVVSRSFDDSFEGGVETNSVLQLTFPRARGIMQVSWEYPLNNGLWIRGALGEVMLDGDDLRTYRRKTSQGWTLVPAETSWPTDLTPEGGKRVRPGNLRPCFDAELVAMLRCIRYGEPFPVTGVQAASVQAAIEHAYENAEPLDCPWLPDDEQVAARAKHWKAGHP